MTTLTIDLPAELYTHIHTMAAQQNKAVEDLVREWLLAQAHVNVSPAPVDERERAIATLQAAGLLAESGPELKARAARSTLTLDQARAILDRDTAQPLSELILEQRGPRV